MGFLDGDSVARAPLTPAVSQRPRGFLDAAPPISGVEALTSGPEYAGASFLDSVLGGPNHPLEDRREFGDVLRDRGVPGWLAAPIGLAGAVALDPLNLLPESFGVRMLHGLVEGVTATGRGGKLLRAAEKLAEHAGEMPTSMRALATEVPDVQAAAAKVNTAAEREARQAYKTVMGTATRDTHPERHAQATQDAAKVAAVIRRSMPNDLVQGSDPLNIQGLYDKLMSKVGDHPSVKRVGSILDQTGHAMTWYARNVADAMRTDKTAWGHRGAEAAAKIEHSELLGSLSEGEMRTFIEKNSKKFTDAELENISEVLDASARPLNDKVAEAAVRHRHLENQIHEDAASFGIKMIVPLDHPAAAGTAEFKQYMAERAAGVAEDDVSNKFAKVPVQYRANHVYKMRDEKVMNALQTEGSPTRRAAVAKLMEMRPGSTAQDAADVLNDIVKVQHDPLTIRADGLQHARDDMLDALGVPWEKNYKKWAQKYAQVVSRRNAQAAVFGGEDQWWKDFSGELAREGGDVAQANAVWHSFISRPTQEQAVGGKLHQFLRQLSTFKLGPRVGALQFLQLSNSAAMFGSANTGRAMGALLRNPSIAKAASVVGALLPSQHLAFDASELDNMSSWWVKLVSGMPITDRYVRTVSALSAGHRLNEIAEALGKGAQGAKRRIMERELYTLGVDAEALAQQGYKPTVRQMQVAMQRGAKITQFTSDITDLPAASRHNAFLRTMFIFRTYSKQQSTFINRIIREARRGNVKPALRYAAAFSGMYNLVEPALQMLQGKEYDPARDGEITDYIKTMFYAGSLGAFGDYLTNSGDTGKLLKSQVGPAIGTGLDAITSIPAALEGDWQPAQTAATRALPGGLGTYILNQQKE